MSDERFTQQEFFQIAREMGLSRSQIKHLRSNRLFPRTTRVGLGRGKGQRFYYPPESVKALKSLIYWQKQRGVRYLEDLRWHLWLYGEGWDWLWGDVRRNLLDMLGKMVGAEDMSEVDKEEAMSILLNGIVETRHRPFGMTKKKLSANRSAWARALGWLVSELSSRHIKMGGTAVRAGVTNLDPSAEIDSLFGNGTYEMVRRMGDLFDLGELSIFGRWGQTLIDSDEAKASAIKPKLQEAEKAYKEDRDLKMLTRFLGIRPLRGWGLHRLPRLVLVCTLLLLPVEEMSAMKETA